MRAVLDTNAVISALLFSGTTSRLVAAWQSGKFEVLVSRAILEEYYRALAYPKFKLTEPEIRSLIEEELLPFIKTIHPVRKLRIGLRDPDDRKFLECAVQGSADHLVTGDKDLRVLGSFREIAIVTPGELLALL